MTTSVKYVHNARPDSVMHRVAKVGAHLNAITACGVNIDIACFSATKGTPKNPECPRCARIA